MSVSRLPNWRQPGCSNKCWRKPVLIIGEREKTILEWHDLPAHRAHDRLASEADILEIGPLRIDRRLMSVELAGQPLYVTPREYSVLLILAARAGSVVSYQQILDWVWGSHQADSKFDVRMLRVTISRLRERLGTSAWLIATRLYCGYWMPESVPADAPPSEPAPAHRQQRPRRLYHPLGSRQQTILDLLLSTDGHGVSVARATIHTYGRSTSETRSAARDAARRIRRGSLLVRECPGPLPEGGWIWIERGAS